MCNKHFSPPLIVGRSNVALIRTHLKQFWSPDRVTSCWDDSIPPHEMICYHLMRWFHTTSWDDSIPPHEMICYHLTRWFHTSHLMRWFHTTSWDDSIPPHEMVPHSYPLGVLVGRYWSQPIKLQWCWASYKLYSFKKKVPCHPLGGKFWMEEIQSNGVATSGGQGGSALTVIYRRNR